MATTANNPAAAKSAAARASPRRHCTHVHCGHRRFLQDNLGQRLTARITNINDPRQVGKWASGDSVPRQEAEDRLRAALAGVPTHPGRREPLHGTRLDDRDEPPARGRGPSHGDRRRALQRRHGRRTCLRRRRLTHCSWTPMAARTSVPLRRQGRGAAQPRAQRENTVVKGPRVQATVLEGTAPRCLAAHRLPGGFGQGSPAAAASSRSPANTESCSGPCRNTIWAWVGSSSSPGVMGGGVPPRARTSSATALTNRSAARGLPSWANCSAVQRFSVWSRRDAGHDGCPRASATRAGRRSNREGSFSAFRSAATTASRSHGGASSAWGPDNSASARTERSYRGWSDRTCCAGKPYDGIVRAEVGHRREEEFGGQHSVEVRAGHERFSVRDRWCACSAC